MHSAEEWALACEAMLSEGRASGAFDEFEQKYLRVVKDGSNEKFMLTVQRDMLDNYILGVFAAKNIGIPAHMPLIAWSAQNKAEFVGLHGEIATIRTLLWAGYDPSSPDDQGATALHRMVNLKYGSGCNPRAVLYLLEAGCDVNHAHQGGDTALLTLCGHVGWTEQHTECFKLLAAAGANLFAVAKDGATPLSLLRQCDAVSPSDDRKWAIDAIEAELEKTELGAAALAGAASRTKE